MSLLAPWLLESLSMALVSSFSVRFGRVVALVVVIVTTRT